MISLAKKYTTKDGRPVDLYALHGPMDSIGYGVFGVIHHVESKTWQAGSWNAEGKFNQQGNAPIHGSENCDLVEVRNRLVFKRWIVAVKFTHGGIAVLSITPKCPTKRLMLRWAEVHSPNPVYLSEVELNLEEFND